LRKILDARRMTEPAPPLKEALGKKKPAAKPKAQAANGPVKPAKKAAAKKKRRK